MNARGIVSNLQIGPSVFMSTNRIHPVLLTKLSFYLAPEILDNFQYVEGMTLESVLTQYGIPFEISPSQKLGG